MPERKSKQPMRVAINLDEETWLRLKHAVVDVRRPMNDIVKGLLMKWLDEHEGRSSKGSRRGKK